MSRIGKKIIKLPSGVTVDFNKQTGETKVKGKLGELSETFLPFVGVNIEGDIVNVTIEDESDSKQNAIWGTSRALLANMVEGVTNGYSKEVELNGVGYRMELAGQNLTLYIGFSHSVKITAPKEIKLELQKNLLKGTSIDKQLIGNFFTNIHDMKPCEPYKHKGFKFPGRFYAKKVGKKAGK